MGPHFQPVRSKPTPPVEQAKQLLGDMQFSDSESNSVD